MNGVGRGAVGDEGRDQSREGAGANRTSSRGGGEQVLGRPPAQLVDALGAHLLPRQAGPRLELGRAHQVDVVALAVPAAVDERDHVQPGPHVRSDLGQA